MAETFDLPMTDNQSTTQNKKLTRKRKRQPETWIMNINKELCQGGKEHRDVS
ncbi:hypothetical protein HHI36_010027, partial [Cryptolaemus montrouzieri]